MKVFLALLILGILQGCVITEITLHIGKKEPAKLAPGEKNKTDTYLEMSSNARELWAYPVIFVLLPFALVGDILADLTDFPFWIRDWIHNEDVYPNNQGEVQ